ncbi:MAG: radical SAM protein [Candidatus Wallacebacter cryptica]|nr:radical SAM protein [Bacillota bacterium]
MRYQGSYRQITTASFEKKIAAAQQHLTNCKLCPRECGVDRTTELGFCQAGAELGVSSFGPHFGEERELVGKNGSGTIFFAHCNLRCVYCQNYQLSFWGEGEVYTTEQLADMMLVIQANYKCGNINLVTPTHYVPHILEAVYIASQKGLRIPIVYNCSGYESIDTLKLLEGVVDIYMPDIKYSSEEWGRKYSQAPDYFAKAFLALKEMDRQVGGLVVEESGLAYRGLLIRHLVLPGGLEETKQVLDFIKSELSPDVLVNLMAQYYPSYKAFEYPELDRRISQKEFSEAVSYAEALGLRLAEC